MDPKVLETMATAISFSRQHGRIDSYDLAQAALQALQEGGYVVVPRVATPEMIGAGAEGPRTADRWDAMVSTFLEQGDQESFISARDHDPSTCAATPMALPPLGHYCPACEAIPKHGYCHLKGCPTRPADHQGEA